MKRFTTHLAATAMLFLTHITFAQSQANADRKQMADSIRKAYMTEAAIGNPVLRQIVVSSDIMPSSSISTFLNGQKIFTGDVRRQRTNVLFTAPIASFGKNTLNATFTASQQHYYFTSFTPLVSGLTDRNGTSVNTFTVGFSPNFTRRDSLFGKPVTYTATLTGLTNDWSSIKRTSFLGGAIFTLKQTRTTRTSIGLLVNIDPSVATPVLPVISYWHKYQSGWELNVNLPQGVSTRKSLSQNLWLNLGESLVGTTAFFDYNIPGIPQAVNYSTLELKSGAGIEYRLAKRLLIGVNAGASTPLQNRAFDRTKTLNDYFLRGDFKTTPFVNFTISVLPFLFTK